jgi:hypothetical protein
MKNVRFEVLTAVIRKSSIFWDLMPRSLVVHDECTSCISRDGE